MNKAQLGLLYMCVADKIDSYTYDMIKEDHVKYSQLSILLSDLQKEINGINRS
jgi:hypothetical protein